MALNPEMLKKLKGKAPRPEMEVAIGIGRKPAGEGAKPFAGEESPEEEAMEGHPFMDAEAGEAAAAEAADLSAISTDDLRAELMKREAEEAGAAEEGEEEAMGAEDMFKDAEEEEA